MAPPIFEPINTTGPDSMRLDTTVFTIGYDFNKYRYDLQPTSYDGARLLLDFIFQLKMGSDWDQIEPDLVTTSPDHIR